MDISELGMRVDSRQVRTAHGDLDRFAQSGKRADQSAKGLVDRGKQMGVSMRAAAAGIAAAAAAAVSMVAATRGIAEFDRQMSKVGAVARASEADMAALRDTAATLGSTTEFSAMQAGEGLEFLARAGWSAHESIEAIPSVLNLATAGALGLGAAADTASNIMSAFALEASRASEVSDVLAAASSRANTDVSQLGDAMSFVGPVASALELQMSDTAAAIGVLSDAGIQGSTAGTGLRRVLSSLTNPTQEASAAMRDMGVSLRDVDPQVNSLADIVDTLSEASLSASDAMRIFGDRGGPAILALVSQNDRLRELTGELSNVEGEAERMANQIRDNLGGDIDTLWSSVQGLILALGEAGLTAVLRGVIQTVTAVVRAVTAFTRVIGDMISAIGQVASSVLNLDANLAALRGGNRELEVGVDNVTIAMGDQIEQSNRLNALMQRGGVITLQEAQNQLELAKARREEIETQIEQQRELIRSSSRFEGATDSMNEAALQLIRAQSDLEYFIDTFGAGAPEVAEVRREIDLLERTIVQLREQREEMLRLGEDDAEAVAQIEANIERLTNAIADAEGGIVSFNDGIVQGVGLSNRLNASLDESSRSLGLAVDNANLLAGGLGRAAVQAGNLSQFLGGLPGALAQTEARIAGLRAGIGALSDGGDQAAASVAEYRAELMATLPPLESMQDGQRRFVRDQIEEKVALFAEEQRLQGVYQDQIASLSDVESAAGGAGGAAKGAADELERLAEQWSRRAQTPLQRYTEQLAELNSVAGMLSEGEYARAVEQLNDELATSLPMVEDVSRAFGDFVADGFRDFQGFVDSVWRSFQGLLSDMISLAARRQIMIGLGFGGGGGIAGTAAAAGGMGGGLGGIGGILGGIGTLGGSFLSGAGLAGSAFLSGGLGSMFSTIGAQVGTAAATGSLSAIGAAAGAIAAPLAAVGGIFLALRGKTKELDRGLQITVENMDTLVETFRRTERSRLFGLLTSRRTRISEAGPDTADPVSRAVQDVQMGVLSAADALGIASDTFAGFAMQVRISTKGLSDEQVQQEIEAQMRAIADGMAEMALAGEGVIREGESASEALDRLANSLTAANRVMDTIGQTMFQVSIAGADMASHLVDLFGGMDSFNRASTSFFESFFTEAEQIETLTRQAKQALEGFNVSLPRSRAELQALVQGLDLTTEGGRELFATLVGMSDTFDRILPSVHSFTDAIMGLVGGAQSAVDDMIVEARDMARASGRAAQQWARASDVLRRFISTIGMEREVAFSPGRTPGTELERVFEAARGGDVEAARQFPRIAQQFLAGAQDRAQSLVQFRRIENQVLGQANLLAGMSELESARQTVLENLGEQQVEVLQELRDHLMATDNLSPEDLTRFQAELGSLEAAIQSVEMINADYLRKRLNVVVDLLPEADIPADVAQIIATATEGIQSTIDFIVRDQTLTPELRWLALQSASEHVKTLDFLVGEDLDAGTRQIALDRSSELRKTVNLVMGSDIPNDEKRIALAGSSELSRVVNVALASDADTQAIRLALRASSEFAVTVQAALDADQQVRQIVFAGAGSYAAMVEAALDLSGAERRILLEQQGDYAVTVQAALSGRIGASMQRLLINAATQGVRAITISAAFGESLSEAEREALRRSGINVLRTVQMQANMHQFSADQLRVLRQGDETVSKIIQGYVTTGSLDDDQKALLQAITGATAGHVTLGGSFKFDPSAAFDKSMRDRIETPMDRLRDSLDRLGFDLFMQQMRQQALDMGISLSQHLSQQVQSFFLRESGAQIDHVSALYSLSERQRQAFDLTGSGVIGFGDAQLLGDGALPQFASGGVHTGGLRIVGERGPELEDTGPSRIYSASDTRSMLDNRGVVDELRRLHAEVSRMREEQRQLGLDQARSADRSAKIARKWDRIGIPETQS